MKKFLPLMLDLAGKEVVIFGAGAVGERKATLFSEFADVIVISRDFTPVLEKLFGERKIRIIKINDLTDNEVSKHIKEDFNNGQEYYAFHGRMIHVPDRAIYKPAMENLAWHNENVYKG